MCHPFSLSVVQCTVCFASCFVSCCFVRVMSCFGTYGGNQRATCNCLRASLTYSVLLCNGTRIYISDGGVGMACRHHASCGTTQAAQAAQALALPEASSSVASTSPSSGPSLSVASGAVDITAEAPEPSPAEKVRAGTSPTTRSLYA